MKINSVQPSELFYQYVRVHEKRSTDYTSRMSSDQVELTGDAKTFSAALKKAKEEMDAGSVNTARIEELRSQIEKGEYFVPGYAVAVKILGEE